MALVAPLLGFGVYLVVAESERLSAEQLFVAAAKARTHALEREVTRARQVVERVAWLFDTIEEVSAADFQSFTNRDRAHHVAIKALEWVPTVTRDDRERLEHDLDRAGHSGRGITEWSASGEIVPAAPREMYFPVLYAEPEKGSEVVVGLDLGSEPRRLAALRLAWVTGMPVLSGPIELVQQDGSALGVLLVVPVTRRPAVVGAVPAGFAVGMLDIQDLVEASLTASDDTHAAGVLFEVVSQASGQGEEVLYASTPDGNGATAGLTWRGDLSLYGQHWVVVARPSSSFYATRRTAQPFAAGLATALGVGLLIVARIAIRRQARERAARAETSIVRSVIRRLPEGVLVADASGEILVANEAARRLVGRGATRVPPSQWSEHFGFFVPDTFEYFPTDQLPLARVLRGEDVSDVELFVRNSSAPSGAWVNVSGVPLRDASGNLVGGVVVFADVTGRKRQEESNQRLSSAVEQTADAVFITDSSGVIEYVNPAFEGVTGFSRDEAVGAKPSLLKSGSQDPSYYRELWSTILSGSTFKAEVVNRRKNGEAFHAEQTITPMRDTRSGKITHFVSVMRDITERMDLRKKELEIELAAEMQALLYPKASPAVPGYEIAGAVVPAADTCGDYYDFIELGEGRVALVVADVRGHGFGPALIMAETRAYLRLLVCSQAALETVVPQINTALMDDLSDRDFVTMILGVLEPATGGFEWANMGHPSGLVLDSVGTVRTVLRSTCKPIGLFADLGFKSGSDVTIEPGETLLMVTDGILEATSPEGDEFGYQRMLDTVSGVIDQSAAEIAAHLISAVRAFSCGEPQEDDLTVVVCKRAATAQITQA